MRQPESRYIKQLKPASQPLFLPSFVQPVSQPVPTLFFFPGLFLEGLIHCLASGRRRRFCKDHIRLLRLIRLTFLPFSLAAPFVTLVAVVLANCAMKNTIVIRPAEPELYLSFTRRPLAA
jgi:hypothetical protein